MANILVVDDNRTMRVLLVRQLQALGWHAEMAESAEDAIKAFLSGNFDMVLMDIHMPVMDGLDAVRRIRELEQEQRREKRIPVIGLTGGVNHDLRECLAAGMDDLMHKPALLADLTKRLQPWLGKG